MKSCRKPLLINIGLEVDMCLKITPNVSGSFIYLDCGAQGDHSNPLLNNFDGAKYIGFDPELIVPFEKDGSSIFFPVAVGKNSGTYNFHRTQNLNCSSFFEPDLEFLNRFIKLGEFFKVVETIPLNVVALDEYLPNKGIIDIDFMELDTQGSELDILKGAENFLSSAVVGIRVEVEFHSMYKNQPLFSDVDAYLRKFGFMLFDLDRYHLRRRTAPVHGASREQIVWGQAMYFKDYRVISGEAKKSKIAKLAVMTAYYGFHSYALEVLNVLIDENVVNLLPEERQELENARERYLSSLEHAWLARFIPLLKKLPFIRYFFRRANSILEKLEAVHLFFKDKESYFWKD